MEHPQPTITCQVTLVRVERIGGNRVEYYAKHL
jgi:hypothetical protein